MNKTFCKKLYDENNPKGIQTAMSLLTQLGFQTIDTAEAYRDRDFIVADGKRTLKIEAEKSNGWTTADGFPGHWYYVSVPYRKRFSGSDVFIMCNKDMTNVAVCNMADIKSSEVGEKFIYMTNMNESFFFVPMNKFDVYVLDNNVWMPRKEVRVLC
jgi:hypothetical protein